jgi:hypothetical protein
MPHPATLYLSLTFGGLGDHHVVLEFGVEADWHSKISYHDLYPKSMPVNLALFPGAGPIQPANLL